MYNGIVFGIPERKQPLKDYFSTSVIFFLFFFFSFGSLASSFLSSSGFLFDFLLTVLLSLFPHEQCPTLM